MKTILILAAALVAAPFAGTLAGAQTVKTADTSKTVTTTTKPTIGPSKSTVSTTKNTTEAKADAKGNMAVHKTSTGKTITYDCSKAGNKNKTACKNKG